MNRLRAAALLVAVTAVVIFGARWYMGSDAEMDRRSDEAELRTHLSRMRGAIARFRTDNDRYPHRLEELVPRYLPNIPRDPFTRSTTTWRFTTEETVQPNADFTTATSKTEAYIIDVHSGAGAPYSIW